MTVNDLISEIKSRGRGFEVTEEHDSEWQATKHYAVVFGAKIKIEYNWCGNGTTVRVSDEQEHDYADFLLNIISKAKPNSTLVGIEDFDFGEKSLTFTEWNGKMSCRDLFIKYDSADKIEFIENFKEPSDCHYEGIVGVRMFDEKDIPEILNESPNLKNII